MKRHFSNRGEALAEVTAGRSLADRKASVKAAFMTHAVRRAKFPQWFSPAADLQIPGQQDDQPRKKMSGFLYEGVPKENRNAIQGEKSFRKKKR